jgi:transposase
VIRVDAVWLAVAPLDMRAGTEAALARVVSVFGAARPHHAYLFANRRANRMKGERPAVPPCFSAIGA